MLLGNPEQHQCSQVLERPSCQGTLVSGTCMLHARRPWYCLASGASLWQVLASAGYSLVRAQHLETSDSTRVPPHFEGRCPQDFFFTIPSLLYRLWKDACEIGSRTLAKLDWERLQVAHHWLKYFPSSTYQCFCTKIYPISIPFPNYRCSKNLRRETW